MHFSSSRALFAIYMLIYAKGALKVMLIGGAYARMKLRENKHS